MTVKTGKISIETVERFLREQLEGGKNISIIVHLKESQVEKVEWHGHARTDEEIASALGGK
ncbi:MAG: hypothetical protein IH886_00945 [Nitrospinae bacterium]|nr:hypothetical protein [Nitrospinota bacterium]